MDTHDKILEAARALVAENGRSSLSFRKVAERAGVSVGSVQYYFSAIEQLLDAVTDPWHEGLTAIFQRTMAALPSAKDREGLLADMCVDIYRLAREQRELVLARRMDTLERGELMDRRREPAQRWLERGAELAAQLVGGDVVRWRLTMLAIEHLLTGFALTDRPETYGAEPEEVEAFLREAILGMGRRTLALED